MEKIPYKCHIMVCVNERDGERQSCADGKGKEIRKVLKGKVKAKGWPKEDVRVSQTLCLGLCSTGPNVMIYPQNILYSGVTLEDVPVIMSEIDKIMEYCYSNNTIKFKNSNLELAVLDGGWVNVLQLKEFLNSMEKMNNGK